MRLWRLLFFAWLVLCASLGRADTGLNTYGMPGLVEMPSAQALPDAELAGTISHFNQTTRSTLTFQVTPRLTAAFRYAGLEGLGGSLRDTLYDRSFDAQFQLAREGPWRPALAFGLRDFIGTGVYSAEYVVATKTVGAVSFTGGVGWGRLGRSGYAARAGPTSSTNQGGQLEATRWFSGDPALFGGLAWQATDRLRFSLEYTADSYLQETSEGVLTRRAQVNLGADWRLGDSSRVKLFVLHGDAIGAALHLNGNPARMRIPSGLHPGPAPVRLRGTAPVAVADRQAELPTALAAEGFEFLGVALTGRQARVDLRNTRYGTAAEAFGRAARVLSQVLPDRIDSFEIVAFEAGMPTVSITVQRRDLEALEHDVAGPEKLWQRIDVNDPPRARIARPLLAAYPRASWGLGPYLRASFFDPDRPVMADVGLRLNAELALAPNVILSGALRKSLAGNFGESDRVSDSVLPRVRSESNRYLAEGDPALETLTFAAYFKPGRQTYGRLTAGYLEAHFAGVSSELLWKPVNGRLALGGELNYVRQRDFDQDFGLRAYDVVTGHLSAYLELANGFHLQMDAGRYLAGDWGATFTVERVFRNGWRIGAYATLTDVSFEDFGEGSFDKGLRFMIPLEPFLGRPSPQRYGVTLQPLTRDGGARLHVDGRLYEQVRGFHMRGLQSNWGRVWR